MSQLTVDCAVIVIPEDKHFVPSAEITQSALEMLKTVFPYAEEHKAETFETIQFVSAELFATSVTCPTCGTVTTRGSSIEDAGRAWFATIDDSNTKAVEMAQTTLPQCGHLVPFTELKFDCPSGFAKFVLTARFTYFDEDIMSEGLQQSEEIRTLSQLIGVQLKAIRTFYALLPSDRALCESLMSSNDEERLRAAQALDSCEPGHFEEHSIAKTYIEDHAEKLLAAYKSSKHNKVKDWILFLMAQAECTSSELTEIVTADLKPDSEFLQQTLYLIYRTPQQFQHLKNDLKKLHNHPNEKVRWRVALALKLLSINYADDIDVIKALMLDDFYAARLEGILAFKKVLGSDPIQETDRNLLRALIDKDENGSAAYYANELLALQK